MKVAYNNCFGGFGLSPLALTKYAEKKGITITWYEQKSNPHGYKKIKGIPKDKMFGNYCFTQDLGDWFLNDQYDGKLHYYPSFEDRSDPDLISVIEELGSKDASGQCAELAIQEVPEGAKFEIDEYDGNESVVPPRQSWY